MSSRNLDPHPFYFVSQFPLGNKYPDEESEILRNGADATT